LSIEKKISTSYSALSNSSHIVQNFIKIEAFQITNLTRARSQSIKKFPNTAHAQ